MEKKQEPIPLTLEQQEHVRRTQEMLGKKRKHFERDHGLHIAPSIHEAE